MTFLRDLERMWASGGESDATDSIVTSQRIIIIVITIVRDQSREYSSTNIMCNVIYTEMITIMIVIISV